MGNVDWARRSMIKEAYGFAMTPFVKESWRKAYKREGGVDVGVFI